MKTKIHSGLGKLTAIKMNGIDKPIEIYSNKRIMNREIKFRVWSKDGEYMTREEDSYEFWVDFGGMVVKDGDLDKENNYILMQYTGLEDRNGKEIYEGDIFRYDTEEGWALAEVKWVENDEDGFAMSGFAMVPLSWNDDQYEDDEDGGWEIIGNIYENPELLK